MDKEMILGMFSEDSEKAKKLYMEFMNKESMGKSVDLQEGKQPMDEKEAKQLLEQMLSDKDDIKQIIKEFKQKTNMSIRQIVVISGLNKDKVNKILRDA